MKGKAFDVQARSDFRKEGGKQYFSELLGDYEFSLGYWIFLVGCWIFKTEKLAPFGQAFITS
jgi:hypothetical protein